MTDKPAIRYDTRSYLQGLRDAYAARCARQDQPDPLAYASGRVEGEAARLRGEPLEALLERSRLPRLISFGRRQPHESAE